MSIASDQWDQLHRGMDTGTKGEDVAPIRQSEATGPGYSETPTRGVG